MVSLFIRLSAIAVSLGPENRIRAGKLILGGWYTSFFSPPQQQSGCRILRVLLQGWVTQIQAKKKSAVVFPLSRRSRDKDRAPFVSGSDRENETHGRLPAKMLVSFRKVRFSFPMHKRTKLCANGIQTHPATCNKIPLTSRFPAFGESNQNCSTWNNLRPIQRGRPAVFLQAATNLGVLPIPS
jgi:hypothetical protein